MTEDEIMERRATKELVERQLRRIQELIQTVEHFRQAYKELQIAYGRKTGPQSHEKTDEKRSFSNTIGGGILKDKHASFSTNHDAVPAALPDENLLHAAAELGNPGAASRPGEVTGNTTSPPGSSGGPINRSAERQSPASDRAEAEPLDVPQDDNSRAAGGRGHHIPSHATPGEGSVQGKDTVGPAPVECSRSVRGSARPSADSVGGAGPTFSRPVAWLAFAVDGSESSAVYLLKEQAEAAAREWGWMIVPLFTPPTLTDAERESLRFCIVAALPEVQKLGGVAEELCRMHRERLRSLLARLSPPAT